MMSDKAMDNNEESLKQLSPERRLLLKQLLEKQQQNSNAVMKTVVRSSTDRTAFPMSLGQERLWFVEKLIPNNITYNVPWNLTITGALNLDLFKKSITHVVNSHEILRTRYVVAHEDTQQVIANVGAVEVEIEDLRGLDSELSEETVNEYIDKDSTTPFVLNGGPLYRLKLFINSDSKYRLVITMHHSITDGVSVAIFNRELVDTYRALIAGTKPIEYHNRVEFGDFSIWQQSAFSGVEYEKQKDYWVNKLKGELPIATLPADRPHPAIRSYNGLFEEVMIEPKLVAELKQLSIRNNVTLFSVLLAAYNIFLHKYTSDTDLLVGIPVAGRNDPSLESVLGYFVNTVVVRTELSDEKNISNYIREVSEEVLGSLAHQDVPFEKVVEAIKPDRELRHTPIFQFFFNYHNFASSDLKAENLVIKPSRLQSVGAQFDLSLHLIEEDGHLHISFNYNTDIFDQQTILRMMPHYENVLRTMVSDSEMDIAKVPLLSDNETHKFLHALNSTDKNYDSRELLHTKFEEHTAQYPNDIALIYENVQLTYKELDERANQFAHFLQNRSVEPNVLVGVLLERSIEMVVSLYAILKAGGCYVPIDPSYPKERIKYMLEDADVPVLISTQTLMHVLPDIGAELFYIDLEWDDKISDLPSTKPNSPVATRDIAYTIYTSGSTGNPKGVMNSHRGIINRLEWMQEAYELKGSDCVMQKTPFSFDVSVWEFFWPLMFGARLHIAKPDGHKDANYLMDVIESGCVTTLHFVPSMLQLFVESGDVHRVSKTLKRVICSGEALPIDLQDRFFEKLPDVELHNLYGPTEAAIDVSYWQCTPAYDRRIVPIGKPISNIQLYVLDKYLNPVPIGVTGELYIGGVGVAKGYVNKVELTAERFIDNPYSMGKEERAKLYKTGDLVRLLDDGNIEYLRREDNQIKIRGLRVELGEIECLINDYKEVRESVVLVINNPSGEQNIVAYVVALTDHSISFDDLKMELKKKLPEHMIPSVFTLVDSMPLSPNGKISRDLLPEIEWGRESDRKLLAPANKLENDLLTVWKTLLKIDNVSRDDNFFDLGGTSLLLVRVQRELQNRLKIDVSLVELYQYTSIKSLAEFVGSSAKDSEQTDTNRLKKQKAMMRRRRSNHKVSSE